MEEAVKSLSREELAKLAAYIAKQDKLSWEEQLEEDFSRFRRGRRSRTLKNERKCNSASFAGGLDLSCETMITSIHTLIYSDDANSTRAFLRDVLGWKYVAEDWDNDWLIFKSGPSEMGVHPTHSVWEGKTYDHPRQHSISLMCDDIDATVDELQAKGAQFRGAIEEREYGRVIMMIVPGADDMQLYQPTHKLAYNL